jgi:glyoxylase-like metal-dependent hydrolase (beta-lactamase superfamily II)
VSPWTELADGVFRQRYNPLDIGIVVIRGADGLLLVDSRSSHREADQIRDDLAELDGDLRWLVNTHAHFDHAWGNGRFGPGSDLDLPIYGHERMPAFLDELGRPMLARLIADDEEGRGEEWSEVVLTSPTVLVGDEATLDLGDRLVELRHLGRGHTDNDLVLHLPDVDLWLAGDLLEESGPPCYGSGCFPLEWPGTVGHLLDLVQPGDVVLPGHGAVIDREYAAGQQLQLQQTADLIRELYGAGVPVDDAVFEGYERWPFPVDGMDGAVRDGYRQLAD